MNKMIDRARAFEDRLAMLEESLHQLAPITIAVSGGVDSTTLASFANGLFGHSRVKAVHASSAAVPKSALARLRRLAEVQKWDLNIVDAGELSDPDYRSNPINRCFFCKMNLYRTLGSLADGAIASGTNCDDLSDYRPGLEAAKIHGVSHPYVTAGFNKKDVRALAKRLGLVELVELPASPCLSSRVETGLPIVEQQLLLIDKVESWLRERLGNATIRCRIRRNGIVVELGAATFDLASKEVCDELLHELVAAVPTLRRHDISIAPYRQGSAFVGDRRMTTPGGAPHQ